MRNWNLRASIALLLISIFLSTNFSYPLISVQATEPISDNSFYGYLNGFSDNDKSVAIGMLFSSIGLWTGEIQSDVGINRFTRYVIYDMDGVINGGSSIWSKLTENGLDNVKLISIVKQYLSFRPVIRELLSIANTLDENAIRNLDKNNKLLLFPLEQTFAGRNVALTFILFKYFDMPIINYNINFKVNIENASILEDTKSLFTISSAENVSIKDSATNFVKEMNKLNWTQIQREMPILLYFKIVDTNVVFPTSSSTSSPTVAPAPTSTPKLTVTPGTSFTPNPKVTESPTPRVAPTPLPTPKFDLITKRIESISKNNKISDYDVSNILRNSSLLIKEITKWHQLSDRYANDSIKSVVKVTRYISVILKKTNLRNDRKLFKCVIWLIEPLKLIPEKSLSVNSLIAETNKLIYSSANLMKNYKLISNDDSNNVIVFKQKLCVLSSLLVKFSSKVFVSSKFIQGEYKVQIDKSKGIQLMSAIAVSSQTAKHFKNIFHKAKINILDYFKYFNLNEKWCLIVIEGINTQTKIKFLLPAVCTADVKKISGVRLMISNKYYNVDIPSSSLSSKYESSISTRCNNLKGIFSLNFSTKNIGAIKKTLIANYKTIGDGKKPTTAKIICGKSSKKIKMEIDTTMEQTKILF